VLVNNGGKVKKKTMCLSVLIACSISLIAPATATASSSQGVSTVQPSETRCVALGVKFLGNVIKYQQGVQAGDFMKTRAAVKAQYKLAKQVKDRKTRALMEEIILTMDGSFLKVTDTEEFSKWQARQIIGDVC
jgi:hypothetical protein